MMIDHVKFIALAIAVSAYAIVFLPPFVGGMIFGMILLASIIYHALEGKVS